MPIELKIPVVGESISEVQISQWLKAEGDAVQKDEPVAVIDSEKTTFDLPAPENGTLTRILHAAGDTVRVGEVIAQLEPGEVGLARLRRFRYLYSHTRSSDNSCSVSTGFVM